MIESVISNGKHESREQGMCAAEMVAYLAGEMHSDHPACLCPVIGEFLRGINDAIPDDDMRSELLSPILLSLAGTRSTPEIERRRAYLCADWAVRVCAPMSQIGRAHV